jgi:hypothetical protein
VDLRSAREHRASPVPPAPPPATDDARPAGDALPADLPQPGVPTTGTDDDREWSWPPGGPWPAADDTRWSTEVWAPATTVRRPLVRLGRWTLVYRRPGC